MFTYSINWAREIRKFLVAVVQRRLGNVQKSVMHLQSCCFTNRNLLLFCRSRLPSPSSLLVIQKFCNHGNVTSHLCSLLRPFTIAKDECFFFYHGREKRRLTRLLPRCNYQTNHLYHPSAISKEKNVKR